VVILLSFLNILSVVVVVFNCEVDVSLNQFSGSAYS